MSSYVWAEVCCSESLQHIKTVIFDWPSQPYICMSPSQQEITLKNTAVESSMQMDSRGAATKASLSSCTSCTEIIFILFPAQKRTFSFQTYFWPLEAPFAHTGSCCTHISCPHSPVCVHPFSFMAYMAWRRRQHFLPGRWYQFIILCVITMEKTLIIILIIIIIIIIIIQQKPQIS